MPRTFVVLPAYNEEEGLAALLDKLEIALADIDYHVVVVDDGSRDATAEVARSRGAELLQHPQNMGLGATVRDGLVHAGSLAAPGDTVVVLDADDTHPPSRILAMQRKLEEGYDVVIASRFRLGSRVVGVSWSRRLYSWGASWLFQLFYPISGVRDFTCGFRAYRAEALQKALACYGPGLVDRDGFECMVDTLLKLRQLKLRFTEVPFVLRYDRKAGATKMNVRRTIINTLLLMVKGKKKT
ncbi:glycosyltransferase family 2 protein [bacterium CPR1]|nr:glycosyltransferase family 2 protein [bacterium CPR1]